MATSRNRSIHAAFSPKLIDVWQKSKPGRSRRNPSQPGEQLDRASLLERVEGDQELLAEVIKIFLADAPQLLVAMRNALQQGDMILLERSAHSMKGAAGNLSAQLTVSAALQLEQNAKNGDAESSKMSVLHYSKAPSNDCFRFLRIFARRFRNEDSDRR